MESLAWDVFGVGSAARGNGEVVQAPTQGTGKLAGLRAQAGRRERLAEVVSEVGRPMAETWAWRQGIHLGAGAQQSEDPRGGWIAKARRAVSFHQQLQPGPPLPGTELWALQPALGGQGTCP